MSMTVTLASGATTVTLPGPSSKRIREVKRQVLGRTAGGTVKTQDLGIDTYELDVSFQSLTNTEKTNLTSFYHTTVDGITTTWTYTDEYSTEFTARFLQTRLEFTPAANNMHDITLLLEVSAMGA